jgi:hypothetical protein
VRVNSLQLNDVAAEKRAGTRNLAELIAEHLLEDTVLYRFKPTDLRSAEGRGLKPSDVKVTSRGVEVTLAPLGRWRLAHQTDPSACGRVPVHGT